MSKEIIETSLYKDSFNKTFKELNKVKRALKALSACNNALVNAKNEIDLLRDICRIIVEVGGYRLAWIGFVEDDEKKIVRPVVQAGYEGGHIDKVNINRADVERDHSPTEKAIRTGDVCIQKNIQSNPEYTPWQAESSKRNIGSSIALPLDDGIKPFGALNIYAEEPDAFDIDEIKLLSELAEDLAYGIITMRTRVKLMQLEELHHESEEKYRILAENANDGIYIISPKGFEYVNHAFEKMFGYEAKEICSNNFNFFNIIHPEDRKLIKEREEARKKKKKLPSVYSFRILSKDGKLKHAEVNTVALPGEEVRILGILRDITERKRMEDFLKKSEKRYKDLIEKAGIAILIDDEEGNVKYCNERYIEMFGYSIKEVKKQSIRSIVHPDDVEKVIGYHKGRMEGKNVLSRYEFKGLRKDGSVIYLEVDAVPLKSGENIIGTRAYLWDISERKKIEAALRESEERFRSVVEYSHEGILIVDDAFKIIYCNDELIRIFGYSKKELIGQDFRKFLKEENKTLLIDRYMRRQRGENIPSRYEFNVIRSDGEKRTLELSSTVIKDSAERVKTVAQVLDITGRRRTEKELEQSFNKLKKALDTTVQAIASTVEKRDPYTAGHQQRVAHLSSAIARKMELSEDEVKGIYIAGVIHDIGKINIPIDILSKPGNLNEIEFNLIKTHPKVGYEIVKNIEFPWPVAQIILQHHERMNGSGYPQGLKSESIILQSRILAVADVVEAMSSHRPYRPAISIDKALEEIKINSSTLYDPGVVSACVKLFLKNGFKLADIQ
ncbi:MAG: PAS domain S-box protein [Candidatus Aminicenantaceae bacterium]